MKKVSKQEKVNLLFSAILILAFVLCSYFFSGVAISLTTPWNIIVTNAIYVVFGLFLFYATRVGDGKPVFRFSLPSLIFVLLPTLYIMIAQNVASLPFNTQIASSSIIVALSAVAFGYGLPYTFVSGFEMDNSDTDILNVENLSVEAKADMISTIIETDQIVEELDKEFAETTENKNAEIFEEVTENTENSNDN